MDYALSDDLSILETIPLVAPSGLVAAPVNDTEVVIAWIPSEENELVSGYRLYRNIKPELFPITTVFPVYKDSGLVTGTEYCYSVEVFYGVDHSSPRTRQVCVTPQAVISVPPGPATNLTASLINETKITLTWTASPATDVIGYEIFRGTQGAAKKKIATVAAQNYTDLGLKASVEYCYTIKAYTATGLRSVDSNESCITTNIPPEVPLAPTNLKGFAFNKVVTLQWDNLAEYDQYKIYMSTSSNVSMTNFTSSRITTAAILNWQGLTGGRTYYFVVTAINNGGESAESNTVALDNIVINNITVRDTGQGKDYYVYETYANDVVTGLQYSATVEVLSDGRFVVGWETIGQPANTDVWGKVYSPSAVQESQSFSLNPFNNSHYESAPSIAAVLNGGFMVTFSDSSAGIVGQLFDTNRSPVGTDFLISTLGTYPAVDSTNNGNFVVVLDDDDAGQQIYARRYNEMGQSLTDVFQVNAVSAGTTLIAPTVVMNSTGEFTVAWHQDDTGNIIARRYLSDGTANGEEFIVNTSWGGTRKHPSLAYTSDNKLVVAWDGNGDTDTTGIYFRIFDSMGSPEGDEIPVNQFTEGNQDNVSLAVNDADEIFIAYNTLGMDSSGIYARMFNALGLPLSDEFRVNEYINGPQLLTSSGGRKSVAATEDLFIVVWDGQTPTDTNGIGVTIMKLHLY